MPTSVTTFLMFQGKQAEEAIRFYVDLFPNSAVDSIVLNGPGEMGPEGTVKLAEFTLAGRKFRAIDSPPVHDFGFTPSISLFVDFEDRAAFDAACSRLSEGGTLLMPPGEYGFSTVFAWLNDRFGVSWQLNVPFA